MAYLNVARFTAASTGTVDFVVSAAVTGYQTPASAGAKDQAPYYYRAESADLTQWEVGQGTYTVSSVTLTRTTVLFSSTGSKVSFTAAPQVGLIAAAEGLRETLTAARTYYVLTTGSDSNSGLANTAGGAFLTIQKAVDTAAALDLSTFDVTIQVGAGTYTGQVLFKSTVGAGTIKLLGDTTTPSNVVISVTAPSDAAVYANQTRGKYSIRGFQIKTVTSGHCLHVKGAAVDYDSVDFGLAAGGFNQIYAEGNAVVSATGNYSISGAAASHWTIRGSSYVDTNTITVTITGTPAFATAFLYMDTVGTHLSYSMTFSGAATGTRYNVIQNSVTYTAGAGATYFPGNVAGSTASGGQYV